MITPDRSRATGVRNGDDLRVSGNVVPAIGPLRVAGRIADDHAEGVAAQGGS